jgi:saccharopine dehydrogenase (NAD+, L-lysine-forming)
MEYSALFREKIKRKGLSMTKTFWLRAETKKNEFRRALTPDSCEKILKAGHNVIVEDWKNSIIPTQLYKDIGCEVVAENSWIKDAPKEAVIIGLKALDESPVNYQHTHIYFAHCYKEQDGWKELLTKFKNGSGKIIDLEFMTTATGRRTNAFGYWAGYVGAALGALFAMGKDNGKAIAELQKSRLFSDKSELINFVKSHTTKVGKAIIIGRSGRSGSGAFDFLSSLKWKITEWDQKETASGGPFKEVLDHDLFVNCVLAMEPMPPFINRKMIEEKNHTLKVISDVSCDPDSDCNMIPLYTEATLIEAPLIKVTSGENPVYLTAIDNLPSILPKESSYDFSSQLEEFIINYTEEEGPLSRALEHFHKHMGLI